MVGELVLVTGGAGFIGSHTAEALLRAGYAVRVLDSLETQVHPRGVPAYLDDRVQFVRGDVSTKEDLETALRDAEVVYHFAAYQDYLPNFSRFFHVNVESTALLYELIVEHSLPVRKVVVASSQAVYGEGAYMCTEHGEVFPHPRSESQLRAGVWDAACALCGGTIYWRATSEDRTYPHNQYALSKSAQEQIALTLGSRYGIPTVALRYSIVQGPRQSLWNAYSGACRIFCLSLHFGQAPVVYEDGRQLRDYVNIADVVEANLLVLRNAEADGRALNVGGGQPWSVLELAAAAIDVFGANVEAQIAGVYRFGDSRHIVSDISRLRALGWEPRFTPADSLRSYKAWLDDQDNVEDIREYADRHMHDIGVLRPVQPSR